MNTPYFKRKITQYRRCQCGAIISNPNNCWECGRDETKTLQRQRIRKATVSPPEPAQVDPEKELREIWTRQGIPEEKQQALLDAVTEKAKQPPEPFNHAAELADWKKRQGMPAQVTQQEMFGKGAVGNVFKLTQEEGEDPDRVTVERDASELASITRDQAQLNLI